MPRRLRPIDDGLVYHVINRGNNRQEALLDAIRRSNATGVPYGDEAWTTGVGPDHPPARLATHECPRATRIVLT